MEPITHSTTGATPAGARRRRRPPLATATLVVAASATDGEVAAPSRPPACRAVR